VISLLFRGSARAKKPGVLAPDEVQGLLGDLQEKFAVALAGEVVAQPLVEHDDYHDIFHGAVETQVLHDGSLLRRSAGIMDMEGLGVKGMAGLRVCIPPRLRVWGWTAGPLCVICTPSL
jgi:hypothetical protein